MIKTYSTKIFFEGKQLGLVQDFKFEEISADDDGLFRYQLKRLEPGEQGVKKIQEGDQTCFNEQYFEGIVDDLDTTLEGDQKCLHIHLYNMDKIHEDLISLDGFPKKYEALEEEWR